MLFLSRLGSVMAYYVYSVMAYINIYAMVQLIKKVYEKPPDPVPSD